MFKGTNGTIALAIGALMVVAVCFAGYASLRTAPAPNNTAGAAPGDPAEQLRLTLDPDQFQGPVRTAYAIAKANPWLLSQLHCYCGCDRTDGHQNLLDCFRDKHGSTCAICVSEARDAEALASRGVSVDQIREVLRGRYAHGS